MSRSLRSETIPINSIIMYRQSGTPTDYTLVSNLDDKLPRGVNSGCCPGSCTGSATHTHATTSTAHIHTACPTTAGAHTHPGTVTDTNPNGNTPASVSPPVATFIQAHTHVVTVGSVDSGTFTVVCSPTHTHDTLSNCPSFKTIKYIKYTRNSLGLRLKSLPVDGEIIWPSANNIPNGYTADTDYDTFYPRGSATPGTTGGSNTHTHDCQTHTHTVTTGSHTHPFPAAIAPTLSQTTRRNVAGLPSVAQTSPGSAHNHTSSLSVGSTPTGAGTASQSDGHTHGSQNHEPSHMISRLLNYTNISLRHLGIPSFGMIEWEESLATIPERFQLADGTNGTIDARQRVITFSTSCPGSTGGSDTHTHTSDSHTHVAGDIAHTHPFTGSTGPNLTGSSRASAPAAGGRYFPNVHTHNTPGTMLDQQTSTSLVSSGGHTHGSQTDIPTSKEVAHIQKLP